jgi:hypothetical protein
LENQESIDYKNMITRLSAILILTILVSLSAQAKPQYGTVTVSKVISVYDGVSLEQELLDNKLAYSYDGGKKLSWCK